MNYIVDEYPVNFRFKFVLFVNKASLVFFSFYHRLYRSKYHWHYISYRSIIGLRGSTRGQGSLRDDHVFAAIVVHVWLIENKNSYFWTIFHFIMSVNYCIFLHSKNIIMSCASVVVWLFLYLIFTSYRNNFEYGQKEMRDLQ